MTSIPAGRNPTEPNKKAIAIAVTGGPSNLPMELVCPSLCEADATAQIDAIFPHESFLDMRGKIRLGDDESFNEVVVGR